MNSHVMSKHRDVAIDTEHWVGWIAKGHSWNWRLLIDERDVHGHCFNALNFVNTVVREIKSGEFLQQVQVVHVSDAIGQ